MNPRNILIVFITVFIVITKTILLKINMGKTIVDIMGKTIVDKIRVVITLIIVAISKINK